MYCLFTLNIIVCTQLTIPVQTIFNITKEKTALLIPNAIQIHATNQEKYGFSSLMNRDVTFAVIKMVWDNSRASQVGPVQQAHFAAHKTVLVYHCVTAVRPAVVCICLFKSAKVVQFCALVTWGVMFMLE